MLLAGIHLAICLPLIIVEESRIWNWVQSQENWRPVRVPKIQPDAGETVAFSPCNLWSHTSLPQRVIVLGELPAAVASGWGETCPPGWSAAGALGAGWPGRDSRRIEIKLSTVLSILIALQWILVGGFPLIHPRRWFWEPGALITILTCTGFLALLAPFLWLLWLILLVFRLLQVAYRGVAFVWRSFRRPAPEAP